MNKYLKIFTWLVLYGCTFVAASGAVWFAGDLNANGWIIPIIAPPSWLFPPVWTILYFLMALAIWNIWIKSNKLNLVYLYFIHLIFNTTWSIVFFGFKNIELALINLIVIILFIVILFLKYKDISKFSAYLMIPYFLWCSYALLLNFNLMILN